MKILLTADPEIPVPPILYGGIERVVDMIARGLRLAGHTVALLARSGSTSPVNERFAWPVSQSSGWNAAFRNAAALRRAVRAFSPDLLHSFSRLLFTTPILRSGLPIIMSFQRPPTSRTVSAANRLASGSLRFTGCSEFICWQGRRGGGVWTAVPNGVDMNQFTFQETVANDAPLLFLSRVERIKGAHTAIAIARRLGKRLVIAGNHSDDGDEGRYWRESIEPKLGAGVEYVGPVNDEQKNQWLGQAAALLVPVEWDEPFGIVFAEALACGTPVISCPRGALPEIVRSGVDGYLAKDLEGLCSAVGRLGLISRRDCRRRAETHFSMPVIVRAYERLYQEAV